MDVWLLLIVVLIILGVIIYATQKSFRFEIPSGGKTKPFPDLKKNPLAPCPLNPQPLELPLTYDPSNGVYTTQIRLGDVNTSRVFTVVPDTGSSILLIPG